MTAGPEASGRFVVLEGVDGSGKSTQVAAVADMLRAHGREVVTTREPGGTALGAGIRDLVLGPSTPGPAGVQAWAEVLLYAADRAQHVAEVIRPALERGHDVVSDRFLWSSLAYQGAGRNLGSDDVAAVNSRATAGIDPDLVVLLDVPYEVSCARLTGRRDRIEAEPRDFHERVRAAFLDLARRHACPVVDASRDLDVVTKEVRELVAARLGVSA
ncbi:MAG: dTMP kinase [Acidimicrobiia bacterium]|nr:dTMP kinase [Acidimicrobiia bacterium]